MSEYVHGYTKRENTRLNDQARSLDNLLHHDSIWEKDSLILEAGCGVGAQTQIIATQNPNSQFISIDISKESVNETNKVIEKLNLKNVKTQQADIFRLPFEDKLFDHVFVCFVLEHLSDPLKALAELRRVLKPGGTIMVIEGDHGSTYFHPHSEAAMCAIQCQVKMQQQNGGNANIGRQLYPLLNIAKFDQISVSPRQVYVDDSNPKMVKGFTLNTFTAMIEGISEKAISENLISEEKMKQGIADLKKTAGGDGTFCYTFFKGVATKSKVTIEIASITDFHEILDIQKKAFVQEAELYQKFDIQPLTQTYEDLLLECSSKVVLKAVLDDKIVGSVRASQSEDLCHINKLVVLPEYQKQGIGSKLLAGIEKCFPNAKIFNLETGLKSENNIRLYTKFGYNIVKKAFFHDNVEAVFMEKYMPPAI